MARALLISADLGIFHSKNVFQLTYETSDFGPRCQENAYLALISFIFCTPSA